jgi:hypothetical protein
MNFATGFTHCPVKVFRLGKFCRRPAVIVGTLLLPSSRPTGWPGECPRCPKAHPLKPDSARASFAICVGQPLAHRNCPKIIANSTSKEVKQRRSGTRLGRLSVFLVPTRLTLPLAAAPFRPPA